MIHIGHRGAHGYEVENTLKSLQKALDLHVDIIEFDVRRCASGELVLFHDKKVDRITDGFGPIKKMTLNEIKQLRTADGQQILTLTEALDFIAGRCMVNIHLKVNYISSILLQTINQHVSSRQWSLRQFLISSFNYNELNRIKRREPDIKVAILYYRHVLNIVKRAHKLSAYSVNLHVSRLKSKLINSLHDVGVKSFVWTVNTPAVMKRARKLKVDGVISDFPDKI